MTKQEENEFFEYLDSNSQNLKDKVTKDFLLKLKNHLTPEQERLLFEAMYKNNVALDSNCEHDILKDFGVHAWKWDEFLSKKD